ncbi:hypothetical protein CPB86DRAFT_786254 [Serendipita vermifera]|nr:hypothetical protein CPB86DRAFT_786254 [Serendipita vermifera]
MSLFQFTKPPVVESAPVVEILFGIVPIEGKIRDEYPLVQSRCHYNIVDVYSIAELVQDYHSSAIVSRDVEYIFPLPPGGAVCSFKAVIDDNKVIKGVVKEKRTAKAQYQAAVAQGKTAGLLQQEHADGGISFVSIIPHDGSSPQAIHITMPTAIAPRYGTAPTNVPRFVANNHNRFDLTVAIQMNKPVTSVRSPSHPIGLTLGCNERELKGDYEPCKAFVHLGASAFLEDDIVIIISAQGLETPRCSVERWLASEGAEETTDAYAFTFVPKFDLPPLPSQEYIFLVDRSGSMWGGRMDSVKASLQIMLRSLPSDNTTFNIVSFGDRYTTMWPNSQPYSAESVEEASKQVDTFTADYGGTVLRTALQFSFKNRVSGASFSKDKTPTAVFVLTDGETWDLDGVLQEIRTSVQEAKDNDSLVRVFVLGIGNQVSTAMCEGMARAGNGSAVFVREGEKPDAKLMGLLRAARGGVIEGLEIEWGVGVDDIGDMETGDDFEVIQNPNEVQACANAPPLSLFDVQSQETAPNLGPIASLTKLPPPPIIQQAPKSDKLPIPLYPGFRCSVFAIVKQGANPRPYSSRITITGRVMGRAVTLQVPVNPVEMNTSVAQDVGVNKLLHTLAAKALIQLFEDMQSTHETRAQIEKLGKRYSLASSVTSFLAVDEESETEKEAAIEKVVKPAPKPATLFGGPGGSLFGSSQPATNVDASGTGQTTRPFSFGGPPKPGGFPGITPQVTGSVIQVGSSRPAPSTGGLFGGKAAPSTSLFGAQPPVNTTLFGNTATGTTGGFGFTQPSGNPPSSAPLNENPFISLFGPQTVYTATVGNLPNTTGTGGGFGVTRPAGNPPNSDSVTANPFISLFASGSSSNTGNAPTTGSPPTTTNTSTGLFGSSQYTASSTVSGTVGICGGSAAFVSPSSVASTPAVSAPPPATSTSPFGTSTGTGNDKPSGGFSFASTPNTGATTGFGSSPSNANTGLFGSSQSVANSTATKSFGFGAFSSPSGAGKAPTLGTPPSATSTSPFGNSQPVASPAGFGGGSPFGTVSTFGANTSSTSTFGAAPSTTSTGTFGGSQPVQNSTGSVNTSPFGGFGSTSNTGSGPTFGSSPSSQSSGPFGNFKPAATGFGSAGVFGSTSAFGNNPSTGNTNPFGSIAFGSTPVAQSTGGLGLFGSSSSVGTTPAFGSSSVAAVNSTGSSAFGISTPAVLSVEALARAQKFDGSFPVDQQLIQMINSGNNLSLPPALASLTGDEGHKQVIWVTILRLADEKDVWENYVLAALREICQDSELANAAHAAV